MSETPMPRQRGTGLALPAGELGARSQRIYETILSNTPDLAYVFDLDHRFIYANQVLLDMWGRSWDEAIGKTCLELGYPDWHAAMHDREIEQVKATRQAVRGQVPFEGTFGARMYDYIFVPVLGEGGQVEAIAGTTRDITDIRQVQDRLAASAERERRRADLLAQVARAGRAIQSLPSVESIAQALTDEARAIIGTHQSVTSLSVDGSWAQSINAVSLSERYARWRDYEVKPDGSGIYAEVCRTNTPMRLTQAQLETHPLWRGFGAEHGRHPPMNGWLAAPLVAPDGRNLGVVQLSDKDRGEFDEDDEAVLVQLAALASASIANAQLVEQLRAQDRRKDEFLAVLAHELRNPLAPIRTGLELLQRSPTPEAAARTRSMMGRQLDHMVHLVDDLMDVARISTGKVQLRREVIDARSAIAAAADGVRPAMERASHVFEVRQPEAPVWVEADPTRLAQAVGNLLNNAAKYTPDGGWVRLTAEVVDNRLRIVISDNGAGIDPRLLPRLFRMFAQDERSVAHAQGGLGIGLALVRELVEMQGGQVQAHSEGLGRGSTFMIQWPLAAAGTGAATPGRTEGDEGACGRPLRVLVVDDNVDAADSLAALLEMSGHLPRVLYAGEPVLQECQQFHPDLVLLDIGLPGADGYAVARGLRLAGERAVLVALTGWGGEADRRRATQAGFDRHLTKPVDLQELDKLLREVAASR